MHVYQKFPCTIDSIRNWPNKKVHENWMQLAVKILWLIKNNQGLLKYSLHGLNLQVYFSKNWLRNIFNLFNIFFAKRQQILGLRNDSSINVHSNNSKKWHQEPWRLSRNSEVNVIKERPLAQGSADYYLLCAKMQIMSSII